MRIRGGLKALLGFAVVIVLVLAACGDDDGGGGGGGGTGTYRVGIDIPFHPLVNYVIANEDAYFGDTRYDVKFRVLDTATLVPTFGKGDLDTIATFPSFLPRIEQNYGIVAREFFPLGRIAPGTLAETIWVPKSSRARGLDDLEGEKVATYPLEGWVGIAEAMVLAATGRQIGEFFDLRESAAPSQQLILGRVAAAMPLLDVVELAKTGDFRPLTGAQEIFERELGDPFVLSGGLVATDDFIAGNPEFIADLIAAFQDAWDEFLKDPDHVIDVAAEQSGVSAEQIRGFSENIGLARIPRKARRITSRDVETWTALYKLLAKAEFLAEEPRDPAKYFLVDD